MTGKETGNRPEAKRKPESESEREKRHAEMLEEALARPGIREVMKVYGHWQEIDRALDPYRRAMRGAVRTRNTNTSNPS